LRESTVLKIYKNLQKDFKVDFYDPYVKEIKIDKKNFFSIKNLKTINLYDAVIIGTDHSNINYDYVVKNSKKIFDSRGVLKKHKSDNIIFC